MTNIYKLFRILFLFMGIAGMLLACPEESSSGDDEPGSTKTDISTLTLSYANVTGVVGEAMQESAPAWGEATAPDATYTIAPALPAGLAIDADTGIISGTPAPGTVQAATPYTVTATGTGLFYTGTKTATVNIAVVEIKINLDTFTTFSYEAVAGIETVALTRSPAWGEATAPDATYTIAPTLPAGLSIDAGTGVISGTPAPGTAQAETSHTVTATGAGSYIGTKTATVTIEIKISLDAFTTFSYEAIAGIETVALTRSPAWGEATAPDATYTIAPALPAGLALDAGTGIISGTPPLGTAQAETSYTVTATGAGSYIGTKTATVAITIQAQTDLSTLTLSYADISAIASETITTTSPAWTGDAPTVTYTIAPALPAGLAMDATTGAISGTPTTTQAAQDYTVTATGDGELFVGMQTATTNIVVFINIFARWKASSSYATITEVNTGTAISTADELKNIQNDLAGTYYLASNIDIGGAVWEPLGSSAAPFTGKFHGNGYIIYGLKIEAVSTDADQGKYQGLFAVINNATVEDVGIGVEHISAVERVGTLTGEAHGTSKIDNVAVARMVDTAEITINTTYVGGLAGRIIETVEVSNAYNFELVVKSTITGNSVSSFVGGLVGSATANKIHGYMFTGDDNTATIISGRGFVGGLVGATGAADVRGYVSGKGEIAGDRAVGGLVGQINRGTARGYFDGGTITGLNTSTLNGIGGLVGRFAPVTENTVIGYVANATISGLTDVGGLVGWAYTGVISGYVVDSTITSSGNYAGGLAARVYDSDRTVVSGYVVSAADQGGISGAEYVGGLVGYVLTATALTGKARIGGYVATSITSPTNQNAVRAFVAFKNAATIMGYWDQQAVGITDNGLHDGTAISDIANIVYNSTTGVYTDSGNGDAVVFDNADFLTQFSLPEASATRPDLLPYRVLPYGVTMSVSNTVTLSDIAPWDNTEAVTWSSSNAAIVSVDADGVATAQAAGSATVTATWSGGGTATMSITVQ